MPVGSHHLNPCRTMPDSRAVASGVVETGDRPRSRTRPRDDRAGDLAPPWPTRRPASAGRPPGHGPPSGSLCRAPAEDARALGGSGRTLAGRVEPGADCRLGSVAGRSHGGEGVDLRACAGRSAGRRSPVPVPATSGQEAERARPHSRSGGHCGASGGGGGEEPGRRLGARTDHGSEAPGHSGVGRGPELEVPVPGVGDGKTASAVTEAITRRLGPVRDRVHTGTADNGQEFARPREIAQKLDAGFSFATPYPSWERGRNEHTNGLVRPYFPKGTDCRRVTPAQVRTVEHRLHRRPRKVLGYRTPAAVFARGLASPGRGWRSPDRPRHSGDSPERLRSASWCRFRPGLGRWLRSGSLAVDPAVSLLSYVIPYF